MIAVVLFATTLIIAYTVYLQISYKEHVQTWATSLLTTLISVLFGVVTAVSLFKYQDSTLNESKRDQLRSLVAQELSNNTNYLKHETFSLQIGKDIWRYHSAFLDHNAIDAAAMSGLFKDLQAKDLLLLSSNIRYYNQLINSIDRIYLITPLNYRAAMAKHLHENQARAYAAMGPNLQRCWKDLDLNSN